MKEYTVKVMMPEGCTCWETDPITKRVKNCPLLVEQIDSYGCQLMSRLIEDNLKLPNCPANAKED